MQTIDHGDHYGDLRRAEYPSESEQIHALMKAVSALSKGQTIPVDAAGVIDQVERVKRRYPKEG